MWPAVTIAERLSCALVAWLVKNLPAKQETRLRSLGREDLLEKEMATHSSILAWAIPWTQEPGGLQSRGHKELDTTQRLNHHHFVPSPVLSPRSHLAFLLEHQDSRNP